MARFLKRLLRWGISLIILYFVLYWTFIAFLLIILYLISGGDNAG